MIVIRIWIWVRNIKCNAWILQGLCKDYARIMHGFCVDSAWILRGFCANYARIMQGFCHKICVIWCEILQEGVWRWTWLPGWKKKEKEKEKKERKKRNDERISQFTLLSGETSDRKEIWYVSKSIIEFLKNGLGTWDLGLGTGCTSSFVQLLTRFFFFFFFFLSFSTLVGL